MTQKKHRRRRSRSGETLAETLAAILVLSCGSVLLAVMLLSSFRLNQTAQEQDEFFYAELTAAEAAQTSTGDAVITVTDGVYFLEDFSVKLYGSASRENGLTSYRRPKSEVGS